MSENKLLKQMKNYLDLGAKHRKKKADELKKVIKKLRKKEKDLIAESEKVGNGKKRDMLRKRIDILHAQRKKGLKALKKIG
jgi:hypothetical protein